jgi:hypothetical protein
VSLELLVRGMPAVGAAYLPVASGICTITGGVPVSIPNATNLVLSTLPASPA